MRDEDKTRERLFDEVRRSEERFRSFMESTPDYIAEADRDGRILFINRTYEGVSAEEVIGTSILDWLPGDARSAMRSAFAKALASGKSEIIEYHAPNTTGEERWYSTHIGPLMGKGRTESVILITRDISERKQAEEALRKSEQQLSALVDNVPVLLSYVDKHGRYCFVNKRYEEWFGLSQTEIIGKHYREVLGENTYQSITDHINTVLSGTRVRYEDVLQYAHGGARWVIADYVPDIDGHGEVKGFYALVSDITDRKRLEEALQESERRLLRAQDVARMGFLDCHLKTGEIHVTPAVCKLFGINPGHVWTISEFVARVVHPDDLDLVTRSFDDAIRGISAYNIDHRIVRPDGAVIWVQAQAELIRDAAGEPERLIGAAVDITERKRVEQALEESEERYRRIVEAAYEGIWLIDAESKTLFVNPRMTEMLGYTRQEMAGESLFRFMDGDWQETAQAHVRRRRAGMKEQHDFKFRRKDGAELWALVTTSPILDETGQYRGALAMITDITERKRMEETLRESEEKFRTVAQASPGGVFASDAHGDPAYWNERVTMMIGMSLEEAKGEGWKKAVHPEDREWVFHKWDESTREKADYQAEHRLVGRDGRIIWVMVHAVPMKDADGQMVGYVGTITNTTARKEAENELRKARDDYLAITNLTGDIIIQLNAEGKWVFLNDGACEFWGKPREDLLGKAFADYIHPDDIERTLAVIEEGKKKDVVRGFVNRQKTPHGWKTVEWNGAWLRDEDGNLQALQATGRDVTERERAQQALRESEERHRRLIQTAHGIIVSYDKEGKITYASGKEQELLGYEAGDVLGRAVVDFLPPEDADRSRALIKEVLGGMEHVNFEQRVLAKDGRVVLMDFNGSPLRDVNGKVIAAVVTGRDITERRRMEEEAERHRQELARTDRLASLGTLVSGVAHELNNPTHFVMLNAPILRNAWRDALPLLDNHAKQDPDFRLANIPYAQMREEIPQLLDEIIEGADRIKHITSELRDYSREQSCQGMQPVAVNDVVRSALTLLATPIRKATSRFSVEYGDDMPRIRGSLRRLEQVVINLIINACQALPDSDKAVRVTTRHDSKERRVIVSVHDEGGGISDADLTQIQNPFYTTKHEEGGTGLGLAVAARIVNEHEGCLEFESKIGEGTTARVLLPVLVEHLP